MNFPSITKKEFERNLSSNFSFENQPYIGICVSGGCDSMALLLLMKEWIKKLNTKRGILTNLHIDLDYNDLKETLPNHIEPAFDNLTFEVDL